MMPSKLVANLFSWALPKPPLLNEKAAWESYLILNWLIHPTDTSCAPTAHQWLVSAYTAPTLRNFNASWCMWAVLCRNQCCWSRAQSQSCFVKVASGSTRTFGHLLWLNTQRTPYRYAAVSQDSGNPSTQDQRQGDFPESCQVSLLPPMSGVTFAGQRAFLSIWRPRT